MRLPRLPEGYSLRKPAVLALVIALLGCSAIFGLTADSMRSAPTATTKDPDIAEFDPVLASFNFRKAAQSSLAMAVSFLRQAQSGAYDLAAVAPRVQQQAKAASEAAAGAKRAVSTANDALAAAKRQAKAADGPGGVAQTPEETEGIRSLEAGVKAAQNYAADAEKFKQGTDKLLAAVEQAQAQEAAAKQQPGGTTTGQPNQSTQPGRPTGPVLAGPAVGGGGQGQPPSWLGTGPGAGNSFQPSQAGPTSTTEPKPVSPCAVLPALIELARSAPAEAAQPAQPAAAGGAQTTPSSTSTTSTTSTTTTEPQAGSAQPGAGGLSPVQAAALVKVCKARAAYKERARDPNAAIPSARVKALNAADAAANADRDTFAAELAAEQRTDPAKPITGYFMTEEFIQPAADAQVDYELKAAAAAQAAAASQAAEAARAANPNDPSLAADAAAKKTAAAQAKAAAEAAKKVAEDIKKIADEVQAYTGHLTSVQTRSRPVLPADTKLPEVTKAEVAWVVLLADLQIKRDAAAKARATAHAALLEAEKSVADLNGIPADTAPAARDALAQATGEKIVATLMAWRAAIAATDAEADAEDMALLAQQLWARADAKRRGVPAPDFPATPVPAQADNAQGQAAQQPQPSAAGADPVDLQPAQQGYTQVDKPSG